MNIQHDLVIDIINRFQTQKGQGLQILMQDSSTLACQLYYFADACGELGKRHAGLYVDRKSEFARLKQYYIDTEQLSAAKAEIQASNNNAYKELYKLEKTTEARHDKAKLMFKAIQEVLSRMNQQIADLRKEQDYQRYANRA